MQPDLQTYALGWFVESYRGHIVVEHSGAVFGGQSSGPIPVAQASGGLVCDRLG